MTDDTWPKTRRADPLMTMTIRIGRIGTVIPPIFPPGDTSDLSRYDQLTVARLHRGSDRPPKLL